MRINLVTSLILFSKIEQFLCKIPVEFADIFSDDFKRDKINVDFRSDLNKNDWGGYLVQVRGYLYFRHIQKTNTDDVNHSDNNYTAAVNLNIDFVDEYLMPYEENCEDVKMSFGREFILFKCDMLANKLNSRNSPKYIYKLYQLIDRNYEFVNLLEANYCEFTGKEKQVILTVSDEGSLYYLDLAEDKNMKKVIIAEKSDARINAYPDFAYRTELFSSGKMFWWNSDSNQIAYVAFVKDSRHERNYQSPPKTEYQIYGMKNETYPRIESVYYEKSGGSSLTKPIVQLCVWNMQLQDSVCVSSHSQFNDEAVVFANLKWLNPDSFVVVWLNRFQNRQDVILYKNIWNLETIFTYSMRTDVENGWIKHNSIVPVDCSEKSCRFLMIKSHQGFQHIWMISQEGDDTKSGILEQQVLTSGNVDVTKIYGVRLNNKETDENHDLMVIFQAAPDSGKLHIYSLSLDYGTDEPNNRINNYPVEYTAPTEKPSENGAWFCFTCINECWQSSSKNCKLDVFNYKNSETRQKCENYDLVTAPGMKTNSQDLALVSCDGPSVPYQFFTRICERTQNFYPWKNFHLVTDNYRLEENLDSKILPEVDVGEFTVCIA